MPTMRAHHVHVLELALQRAAAHTEHLGGDGAVVAAALEGLDNELMLDFGDVEIALGFDSRIGGHCRREVLGRY